MQILVPIDGDRIHCSPPHRPELNVCDASPEEPQTDVREVDAAPAVYGDEGAPEDAPVDHDRDHDDAAGDRDGDAEDWDVEEAAARGEGGAVAAPAPVRRSGWAGKGTTTNTRAGDSVARHAVRTCLDGVEISIVDEDTALGGLPTWTLAMEGRGPLRVPVAVVTFALDDANPAWVKVVRAWASTPL